MTEVISGEEFRRKRMGSGAKYHAKKVKDCWYCGFTHDSQAEARRCKYLHMLKNVERKIVHIDVHPFVTLEKKIRWKLDFLVHYVRHDGILESWYEDVKGHATRDFLLKLQMFINSTNPIPLNIVEASLEPRGEWLSYKAEEYLRKARGQKKKARRR